MVGAVDVGVPSLAGHEIELLLRLLETQADPLLVERPHVAAQGAIGQPKLVKLVRDGADA